MLQLQRQSQLDRGDGSTVAMVPGASKEPDDVEEKVRQGWHFLRIHCGRWSMTGQSRRSSRRVW